jgi:hypothetical protein
VLEVAVLEVAMFPMSFDASDALVQTYCVCGGAAFDYLGETVLTVQVTCRYLRL